MLNVLKSARRSLVRIPGKPQFAADEAIVAAVRIVRMRVRHPAARAEHEAENLPLSYARRRLRQEIEVAQRAGIDDTLHARAANMEVRHTEPRPVLAPFACYLIKR